jgi:Lrp/AsnC family transcriptional regulator, regulator for asnA, asnC and gidA
VIILAVKLDEKDKQILNILQENGRASYLQIANELEISEATVRYRVKKLIDQEIIKRFTILLDPTKIGYPTVGILMVKISPERFELASKEISELEETRHVLQNTGEYDIVAVVRARDLEHLNDLRKRVELIPGVKGISLSAATRLIKIDPSFEL